MARVLLLAALAVLVLGLAARARREAPPPSPWCRRGEPLAGVYHPSRLHVKRRCFQAAGTVSRVAFEEFDGDVHVDLQLDDGRRLVVEVIPQDRSVVPIPKEGDRVTVVGPLVTDLKHGWDEIHPAWWISGGRVAPASPAELKRVEDLLAGRYADAD